MITQEHINDLLTRKGTVVSADGEKIGSVEQVYADDESGQPTWVTAKTGLFGSSETFVPIEGARLQGDDLVVAYAKDLVKDAPRVDADGHLEPNEEERLYSHYQLSGGRTRTDAATPGADTGRHEERGTIGHDTSGPTTDGAMTRSEERLHVGTEKQEASRVRLRKYVVAENVTQTVPVQREEVRIEREPITEANRGDALDGPAISEEEHVVVLHEERPVVEKETVPVERVRLGKETVTENAAINEEVRKERIETDGIDGIDGTRR